MNRKATRAAMSAARRPFAAALSPRLILGRASYRHATKGIRWRKPTPALVLGLTLAEQTRREVAKVRDIHATRPSALRPYLMERASLA